MEEIVARSEPLVTLERAGALTRTGLVVPVGITEDEFEALGRMLGEIHETVEWAMADWLIASEALFSEREAQLSESLGLSEDKRAVLIRVASRFRREERRPELSFSHHRIVSGMKDTRRRDELLEMAVVNRWTKHELAAQKANAPVGELPEPSLDFRYRKLKDAAKAVWDGRSAEVDGYMVGSDEMDALGAALEW